MRVTIYKTKLREDYRIEAVKEKAVNYKSCCQLLNSDDTGRLCVDVLSMNRLADEHAYVLIVNNRNCLLGVFEVAHGGSTECSMHVRDILAKVLLIGGTGFIFVHNHPSGDLTPSAEDVILINQIKSGSELLDLRFLDSLIIGGNMDCDYYSMAYDCHLA